MLQRTLRIQRLGLAVLVGLAGARWALAVMLGSILCSCSPSSSSGVAPTPTPPVFGCPPAPPTPSPYPPLTTPFSMTFNPDPLWLDWPVRWEVETQW